MRLQNSREDLSRATRLNSCESSYDRTDTTLGHGLHRLARVLHRSGQETKSTKPFKDQSRYYCRISVVATVARRWTVATLMQDAVHALASVATTLIYRTILRRFIVTLLEFLILLLIAGVCGALAQSIAGYSHGGCLVAVALGFVGALLGTWLARVSGLPDLFVIQVGGRSFPIIWSIIGGALFAALLNIVSRPRVVATGRREP